MVGLFAWLLHDTQLTQVDQGEKKDGVGTEIAKKDVYVINVYIPRNTCSTWKFNMYMYIVCICLYIHISHIWNQCMEEIQEKREFSGRGDEYYACLAYPVM